MEIKQKKKGKRKKKILSLPFAPTLTRVVLYYCTAVTKHAGAHKTDLASPRRRNERGNITRFHIFFSTSWWKKPGFQLPCFKILRRRPGETKRTEATVIFWHTCYLSWFFFFFACGDKFWETKQKKKGEFLPPGETNEDFFVNFRTNLIFLSLWNFAILFFFAIYRLLALSAMSDWKKKCIYLCDWKR